MIELKVDISRVEYSDIFDRYIPNLLNSLKEKGENCSKDGKEFYQCSSRAKEGAVHLQNGQFQRGGHRGGTEQALQKQ